MSVKFTGTAKVVVEPAATKTGEMRTVPVL